MASRITGSRFGAGAISTTFWCRRCTEQSRSNRCTVSPWRRRGSAPRCAAAGAPPARGTSSGRRRRCPPPAWRPGARPRVLRALDAPHAAAAAARDGLREDREADPLRLLEQQLHVGRRRRRREDRHAGRGRVLLGRDLVASHLEHPGGGADEDDAVVGGRAREVGVLGEEPVARVDGVGAALERHADDLVDVEVRPDGVALLADEVRLVRLQAVQRVPVLVRVDGDRAGAQLDGGPERADRDLPRLATRIFSNMAGPSVERGFGTPAFRSSQSIDGSLSHVHVLSVSSLKGAWERPQ